LFLQSQRHQPKFGNVKSALLEEAYEEAVLPDEAIAANSSANVGPDRAPQGGEPENSCNFRLSGMQRANS